MDARSFPPRAAYRAYRIFADALVNIAPRQDCWLIAGRQARRANFAHHTAITSALCLMLMSTRRLRRDFFI